MSKQDEIDKIVKIILEENDKLFAINEDMTNKECAENISGALVRNGIGTAERFEIERWKDTHDVKEWQYEIKPKDYSKEENLKEKGARYG